MAAKITHFKVTRGSPDRMRAPRSFWPTLKQLGLTPGVVLRHSNIPPTAYGGDLLITTGQLFALWRSIRELSKDPAAGWKLMRGMQSAKFHPSMLAALHARIYRECLERHARYKQLCSAQEFRFTEKDGELQIETSWPFVPDERPPALMIDAVFAILVELGRRGTEKKLRPNRLELSRPEERGNGLAEFFGCAVKYRCARDKLVLNVADVELPFVTHNEELVQMLAPQFEHQLKSRELKQGTLGSVKWVLRRLLSGSRPDVAVVAKELGMSERTLQRRITEEGMTFRQLLNETRKELIREYLSDDSVEITEAAFLVGFENTNSFYRAFRSWEGKTPAEWRAAQRDRN
jgi:AraC-like DNA-binding protein